MTTQNRKPGKTGTAVKTATQRQAALRARRLAAGLTEVRNIYLPSALHAVLKKLAKTLGDNAELCGGTSATNV